MKDICKKKTKQKQTRLKQINARASVNYIFIEVGNYAILYVMYKFIADEVFSCASEIWIIIFISF